jgi:hypothetical protein
LEIARANPTLRCWRTCALKVGAVLLRVAELVRRSFLARGFLSLIVSGYKRQKPPAKIERQSY